MEIIKSDISPLFGVAVSRQGGRAQNQDDFCYLDTPLGFLVIVCDGMGGGPGGRAASFIAKREIAAAMLSMPPATEPEQAFREAAARAHATLEREMSAHGELRGMGSTFVAMLVRPDAAYVAHAGDSRCYRIHGGRCVFRTRDHSLVAELVAMKALTEEQARTSPQSNVVARGLGSTSNHVPETERVPYRKDDRFILCTDGLWGAMPHETLLRRLTARGDIGGLAESLSRETDRVGFAAGGHHDNHTLAIVEMQATSTLGGGRERLSDVWSRLHTSLSTLFSWRVPVQTRRRHVLAAVAATLCALLLGAAVAAIWSAGRDDTSMTEYPVSGYSGGVPSMPGNLPEVPRVPIDTSDTRLPDTLPRGLRDTTRGKPVTARPTPQPKRKAPVDTLRKRGDDALPVLIQKVSKRYETLKGLRCKTNDEARKEIGALRAEIGKLLDELCRSLDQSPHRDMAREIRRYASQAEAYTFSRNAVGSRLVCLTDKAMKAAGRQQERLSKLKRSLQAGK